MPHPSATARRIALPLLAALMLMLQAVGLWHRVVHGAAQAAVPTATVGHDHAGHDFAGHEDGDAQCRLYDQIAHADLASGEPLSWACDTHGAACDAAVPAGRLAPQAAGFLARGPPYTA